MQRIGTLCKVVLVAALALTIASPALADQFVNGHFRRDGTYVQPHWRSNPDGVPYNNFGYPGNLNPYTGKVAPGNPYLGDGFGEYHRPTPRSSPYGSYLFDAK